MMHGEACSLSPKPEQRAGPTWQDMVTEQGLILALVVSSSCKYQNTAGREEERLSVALSTKLNCRRTFNFAACFPQDGKVVGHLLFLG